LITEHAKTVTKAIIDGLKPLTKFVLTITSMLGEVEDLALDENSINSFMLLKL
jgi:hypothetical protein